MKLLAHWFLPRSSNNYRAKLVRPGGVFTLIVFIVFLQIFVSHLASSGLVLGEKVVIAPEKIIEETNKKRVEAGLPPLRVDQSLMVGAGAKGSDMITNDYWAHVSPQGVTPWTFFLNNDYSYKYAGENLARDFTSASEVVAAWMASPTHRENLLSPRYQDIGIAVVQGELNGGPATIVVQFLGTKTGTSLAQIQPNFLNSPSPVSSNSNVLEKTTSGISVSKFDLKRPIALGVLGLLFVVLMVDAVVLFNRRIIRVSGRTLAHVGFISSFALLLILSGRGSIL